MKSAAIISVLPAVWTVTLAAPFTETPSAILGWGPSKTVVEKPTKAARQAILECTATLIGQNQAGTNGNSGTIDNNIFNLTIAGTTTYTMTDVPHDDHYDFGFTVPGSDYASPTAYDSTFAGQWDTTNNSWYWCSVTAGTTVTNGTIGSDVVTGTLIHYSTDDCTMVYTCGPG